MKCGAIFLKLILVYDILDTPVININITAPNVYTDQTLHHALPQLQT